jgi:hypothetical protein
MEAEIMSNIFENNERTEAIHKASVAEGNKLYSVLPALPNGQRYELRDLADGRVAIYVVS